MGFRADLSGMAKALVPDDLWAFIAPLLPPARPRPRGGRPPIPDRAALTGILFVPRTGLPWEHLPAKMGCGSGMTCWRRLQAWQQAGVWAALHELEPGLAGQHFCCSQRGGSATGPNPKDRGKPGTKRHLVVDRRATPLGVTLSGANRHDSMMLAATLDAIPCMRRKGRGRPRRRPDRLHADKGHDHRRCRAECRARGIKPRIARRGIKSSQRLGRHRWVVERTHAWMARLRRLAIRYERREDIHLAFVTLGCALACLNQIRRFCWAL